MESKIKKLLKYRKIREAASLQCSKEQTVASNKYYSITDEGNLFETELFNELKPIVNDYFNWDCGEFQDKVYPDDIVLQSGGVWVRFDADHPNDIRDFVVPYADLMKKREKPAPIPKECRFAYSGENGAQCDGFGTDHRCPAGYFQHYTPETCPEKPTGR